MLRFAPSLSGEMQIEDLRLALFNALVSRRRNESMVVRIEETDDERIEKEVLEVLGLFGIEYSDVIHQSKNLRFYRAMAIQLLQEKRAFNCFCTPETLEKKRVLAQSRQQLYRYDDSCTHLPPEATIDNENPFTIRLQRPGHAIEVTDLLRGSVHFTPEAIDSFVIMGPEKFPTHTFADAVDDMLSDISLVICSEAHLEEAPRQIAVREALGYTKTVEYAHLPAILDDAGEPIDRSSTAYSVKELLEAGYLPEAIGNYLILLGSTAPETIFTIAEAAEWFDLGNLSRSPARFDFETLRSINREHLRRLDAKELSRYVGFADDDIGEVARIFLDDVGTLSELRAKMAPIFAEKTIPASLAEAAARLREAIKGAPHFDTFEAFKAYLIPQTGLDEAAFSAVLRLLLTGSEEGPELAALYRHLKNYLGEIVK
jgi:glutamyl-tRNA synthetase